MTEKIIVGWEEWCSLPQLGLIAIKAKVDTGATTSSLHAFNITPYEAEGILHVRFQIDPLQKGDGVVKLCSAPVVDRRVISDSGGHREERYIISTCFTLGGKSWEIELSLTDRESMQYKMLLGRRAMENMVMVDPAGSFLQGKLSEVKVRKQYLESV